MGLVIQIVVLLVVLMGLITIIMSIKNWHWAQMTFLLLIFLCGIGAFILALDVYRIHRNIRRVMPQLETQLAQAEVDRDALLHGTRDQTVIGRIGAQVEGGLPIDLASEGRMASLAEWERRLQDVNRERGRVWRGVQKGGPVDKQTGRIPVTIAQPKPHGLARDAIVYAFEQGDPGHEDPKQGAQYLGEFRVVEVNPDGALLDAVQRLDNRTGARLDESQKPWSLYETMPADRHELFAGYDEKQLREMLPVASAEEYIRHGTEATPDDDEYHRAGYDEAGARVGADDAAKDPKTVVAWKFDRPLRDYAFLFAELARQRTLQLANRDALRQDIAKLQKTLEDAKQLTALRQEEKTRLTEDLAHMENDRKAIETLRDSVEKQLANAKDLLARAERYNLQLERQLVEVQTSRLSGAGAAAGASSGELLLSPAAF